MHRHLDGLHLFSEYVLVLTNALETMNKMANQCPNINTESKPFMGIPGFVVDTFIIGATETLNITRTKDMVTFSTLTGKF